MGGSPETTADPARPPVRQGQRLRSAAETPGWQSNRAWGAACLLIQPLDCCGDAMVRNEEEEHTLCKSGGLYPEATNIKFKKNVPRYPHFQETTKCIVTGPIVEKWGWFIQRLQPLVAGASSGQWEMAHVPKYLPEVQRHTARGRDCEDCRLRDDVLVLSTQPVFFGGHHPAGSNWRKDASQWLSSTLIYTFLQSSPRLSLPSCSFAVSSRNGW